MRTAAVPLVFLAVAVAPPAGAQVGNWRWQTDQHDSAYTRPQTVDANGRCNGMSYGTGARRCGTMTGGPSGGRTNTN